MNISNIKDFFEILYYISFIILTVLIVRYARKTYILESEKKYELLCNLTIMESISESYLLDYALEIYNAGNKVAKKVDVQIEGKYITTINFVKPNCSATFPLGQVYRTLGGVQIVPSDISSVEKDKDLHVVLTTDKRSTEYALNTDILFAARDNIASTLKGIENKLDNIERAIRNR